MSDWIEAARELEDSGKAYVVITVLGSRGSTPRDSGTKMLVAEGTSYCSIGGGHLEYKAIAIAGEMLARGETDQRIEKFPLGPRLGQCCGGSTSVLFECFAAARVNIMLFGAGHVGKALISILGQLPCRVQWVDTRQEQFLLGVPGNVTKVLSESPVDEVESMPAGSYYIVMTHNHQLDFAITEAVIKRDDARYIGLIGSKTKWRRFKLRFEHRGFSEHMYHAVRCPVGLASVPGKLPMEVATSVAGEIIAEYREDMPAAQTKRGIEWRELKNLIEGESVENNSSEEAARLKGEKQS